MYDNWEERGKPFEGIGGGVVKQKVLFKIIF